MGTKRKGDPCSVSIAGPRTFQKGKNPKAGTVHNQAFLVTVSWRHVINVPG
jgi:hypothetical protein